MVAPLPAMPPDNPVTTVGAVHVYVVVAGTTPLVEFAGVAVNNAPLQAEVPIAFIAGFGFTVTVKLNGVPVHPAVTGVTL